MSFGQYKILSLTLPTVAAFAVLSILWFRHHQKKRRPRVDSPKPNKEASESLIKEEIGRDSLPVVLLQEASSSPGGYGSSEEPLKKKKDIELLVASVEDGAICAIVEDRRQVEVYEEPVAMAKEAKIICELPQRGEKHSLEDLDTSSDLEEGEIRSPNDSFSAKKDSVESVSKQDSEDRDSVFDSEDSGKRCTAEESDLEEGEIRSTDGRTEEMMKKDTKELTEKLASLELNQKKDGGDGKELPSLELDQCKERDSANHSPSEVMLASPSISNFSDAHSEHSSDSGKGQSDAALSPSRTPAGGSSLAGEQAPSVYEFVLPQVIVGRLIGRHGAFLHEIKTETHTNIFIKRHPDSNKLKICAIEGSQQDIDKALAKIRHKFPLRRFPQLTLEKVSFVQVSPLPPLKPEDFHLTLVEGVNNDVVLSSLISAAHFFLQQPCHPSYASLAALNSIMSQLYTSGEAPLIEAPVTYAICAAPAMGGWYRAQIVHVEEDQTTCTVRFLDYGGYSVLDAGDLRQIRGDLLALPFQAVECYLANVAPSQGGDEWSEEARLFVQSLTCGQVLHAQVYDYAEDGNPLVYLYAKFANQVVLVNEELVVHGYGVIAESTDSGSAGAQPSSGGQAAVGEQATSSDAEGPVSAPPVSPHLPTQACV